MRASCGAAALVLGLLLGQTAVAAPGLRQPEFNAAARAAELQRIASLIEQNYVYKDKAREIAGKLRAMGDEPELRTSDPSAWAGILTRRLKSFDLHFNVSWSPPAAGSAGAEKGRAVASGWGRMLVADAYGFERVARLDGNIGYIRMNLFAPFGPPETGERVPAARQAGEAALKMVENTDAMIFDLRGNRGGSPEMVDLLLSPFFEGPVLLNTFYEREGDQTESFTTLADFKGAPRSRVPLFVLVSGRTASAAEEFAYDVQTQKRGLVVGETTAGGANPGGPFDAGEGFTVFISTGAAINPITHTNWDGAGVKPDVPTPSAAALDRAHEMALQAVLQHGVSTAPLEAQWTLERLAVKRARPGRSATDPKAFIGQYGDRTIAIIDGRLAFRSGRSPWAGMLRVGSDTFALEDVADRRLRFERDPAGRVVRLIQMDAAGGSTPYARSQPEPASAKIRPKRLAAPARAFGGTRSIPPAVHVF